MNGITYSSSNTNFSNQCIFNGNVQLSKTSGSTYVFTDFRLINAVTKNTNEFAQIYCANSNWDNVLYRPNGNYQIYIRNSLDTSNIQVLQANLTNFNIKNTNCLIDNNLTVNGTTNLKNTNITGDLIVNGLNIKNEIDALDTSFTTGTINTNDLVTGNLTATGTTNLKTTNIITSNGTSSTPSLIVRDNGNTSFTRTLAIIPNSSSGAYNPNVASKDLSIVGTGTSSNQTTLSICTWSSTKSGFRTGPQFCELTAGSNSIFIDSTAGTVINGSTSITGLVTYANTTPSSVSNTKTLSTFANSIYTSQLFSISFSGSQKRTLNIVCPISYYRSSIIGTQGINISNVITTTINNLTVDIYKNNSLIQTITPSYSETLPKTISANKLPNSTGQTYSYEIYLGKITFSYDIDTPTIDT